MTSRDSSSEQSDPSQPSARSIRVRLIVLVLLVVGIAVMINGMLFFRPSPADRAVDAELQKLIKSISDGEKDVEKKTTAMSRGKSFDFATLSSQEELGKRIAIVNEARKANNNLIDIGEGAPNRLREALKAQQVPQEKIDSTIKLFNERWAPRKLRYEQSGRLYRAGGNMLQYLKETWGHWKFDAADGGLHFDTKEAGVQADGLLAELQEAIKAFQAQL